MKERPILMTPENAQKVFEGTKTQTRRLNTLCKVNETANDWGVLPHRDDSPLWEFIHGNTPNRTSRSWSLKCPYGVVGDRLWILENGWERPERTPKMLRDGADTWERFYFDALLDDGEAKELKGYGFKRRPSIHMPRWACRTVVELVEVRVERVQEISQEDAIAEGCGSHHTTPREEFTKLWESINGKGSWAKNSYVWVLSFRRIHAS